jgi:hypothetical protein
MRGGWSGRGGRDVIPRKRSSVDAKLDENDDIKDTASSPMKTNSKDGAEEDIYSESVRRKLDLVDLVMETKGGANIADPKGNSLKVPPPPLPYVDTGKN